MLTEREVTNTLNAYPDFLLQANGGDDDGQLYSLLRRDDINDDHADYKAKLVSRPLKLENALALKSILQMHHIKDISGTLAVKLEASDNLNAWVTLTSLRGKPWKYYRLTYLFDNLSATDRFTGTLLVTEERRTNKLR